MDNHEQFNGAETVARMTSIGVLAGVAEAQMYRRAGLVKGPWESFAPLVGFLCLAALAISWGDATLALDRACYGNSYHAHCN